MITEDTENFLSLLQKSYAQNQAPSWIKRHQDKFWERLSHQGLDLKSLESFQYVRSHKLLKEIKQTSYERNTPNHVPSDFILPECSKSYITFYNGSLQLEYSSLEALPDSVELLPLEQASKKFSAFLMGQLTKKSKEEKDPFALMNLSFLEQGAFLYVPPKTKDLPPIQIISLSDRNESLIQPHLQIVVGKEAKATFITTTISSENSSSLVNQYVDLFLDKEAEVQVVQKAYSTEKSPHLHSLRAQIKKSASLDLTDLAEGVGILRKDYHIELVEEESKASLRGLHCLSGRQESHAHVLMEHQAPNCQSSQLFKGVLAGRSRFSFEGKIYVHKEAQQTDAFQANHNLLLSDDAFAASKPNLEIFADDVSASHGSTVGQLDPEQLFYLRTRGLSLSQAKSLLLQGFCKEIYKHLPLPSLQAKELSLPLSFLEG